MIKLLQNKLKEDNPDSNVIALHCLLHQESLCKSALNLSHVIKPVVNVVNTIRARALNHRQFAALLEDVEAEFGDVIYHNSVRWLSLGKVLKRVWALREEILLFLDMKGIACEFADKMKCEEWKFEFMFSIDIFEKLNELNVSLQGKGLLVHEMLMNVESFKSKLSLVARQSGEGNFCHFPVLKQQKVSSSASSKIKKHLLSLEKEMGNRF